MAIIHEGELKFAGVPSDAERELQGRVWQKSIEKSELGLIKETHDVLSTKLVAGRPLIHIMSEDDPGDGFKEIEPDLEDVFFSKIEFPTAV